MVMFYIRNKRCGNWPDAQQLRALVALVEDLPFPRTHVVVHNHPNLEGLGDRVTPDLSGHQPCTWYTYIACRQNINTHKINLKEKRKNVLVDYNLLPV